MSKSSCLLGSMAAVGAQVMGGGSAAINYPFGTTFPMTDSQPHSGLTWEGGVYMGTTLQFNPGAYFAYTNSYNVPKYPPPTTPPPTPAGYPTFPTAQSPTPPPTPSYAGQYCSGWQATCPLGYYCQLTPGYNPYQTGSCQKYGDGTGGFPSNDLPEYTGPSKPDMVQDHSGGSCAPPSACGFQSLYGTCWCDLECEVNGDCCSDYKSQGCPAELHLEHPEIDVIVDVGGGDLLYQPICFGPSCGVSQPFYQGTEQCFCDTPCLKWGDCCHDFQTGCPTQALANL